MITEENFEEMYAESLRRLDEYIAKQVTEKQIFYAKHHKNSVVINKGHFAYRVKNEAASLYLCSCCGKLECANYVEPVKSQMLAASICFHCNYWKELAAKVDKTRLVIDGAVYGDGGNSPNSETRFLGFGGHVWKIERDGKVWETNNLWSGSTIPQEFVHLLPDNAKFLKRDAS